MMPVIMGLADSGRKNPAIQEIKVPIKKPNSATNAVPKRLAIKNFPTLTLNTPSVYEPYESKTEMGCLATWNGIAHERGHPASVAKLTRATETPEG